MRKLRGNLFSMLNLHILGVALLLVLDLVLGLRLFLSWRTIRNAGPEQIQQKQIDALALTLETRPLRGLPHKVEQARIQEDRFYVQRFPAAYSTILATIGDLADKNNVRLTHTSYVQAPAAHHLDEVRMDASLSGEYAPVMHFINGLERSKTFFLINGLTLTGQQGGLVNLRLLLTTYLHTSNPEHTASSNEENGTEKTAEEAAR